MHCTARCRCCARRTDSPTHIARRASGLPHWATRLIHSLFDMSLPHSHSAAARQPDNPRNEPATQQQQRASSPLPTASPGVRPVMSDPVQECLNALDALYNHADPAVKHRADQWLVAFQREPMAWQVADQLLHRPALPETAYYFAANTLHSKLLFSFNELRDAAQRQSFRDSLVSHIGRFAASGTPTVRTRLALCVACLAVHMVGLGEWSTCIDDLIRHYSADGATAAVLLDILAYLPEENHNPKLMIPLAQRVRAQQEMLQATSTIVALLMHFLALSSKGAAPGGADYLSSGLLHAPNTGAQAVLLPRVTGAQKDMQKKILACFLSWVKATGHSRRFMANIAPATPGATPGASPSAAAGAAAAAAGAASLLTSTNLISHPLLLFCFKLIASRSDELEQIAIDVLGSLLKNFNLVSRHLRGGFRGFKAASRWAQEYGEEDGEGEEDGRYEPHHSPQPDGSPSFSFSSSPNGSPSSAAGSGAGAGGESQYQHVYFMRFMITRILELVPLFDALPLPEPGEDDSESTEAELARCYSRLFVDLGEYYLDFVMEFCVGTAGFSSPHEQAQLRNLHATMVEHAKAAAAQPALLAALPAPAFASPAASPAEMEQLVLSNQDLAMQIVGVVLKCAGHPRREVNSNAMYFWFLLSEALSAPVEAAAARNHSVAQSSQSGATTPALTLTPLQVRQKKKEVFYPLFVAMVPNLHRVMTYPPGFLPPGAAPAAASANANAPSAEEEEEIFKARKQAADTLLDVERLVGFERILELLCSDEVMGAQFRAFVAAPAQQWRDLEASLFCIRSLADRVCESVMLGRRHMGATGGFASGGSTNQTLVPKILDLLLDPASPVMQSQPIKYTALNLLGRYAPWIREHDASKGAQAVQAGGGYLHRSLSAIVTGLSDPLVCGAAARALKYTCEDNREVLANCKAPSYLPNLIFVYKQCCAVSVVGAGKNQSGLTLEDQKEIIEGVAAVVSCIHSSPQQQQQQAAGGGGAAPPADELPHYLHEMVLPMIEELQKIIAWAQQQQQAQAQASPTGAAVAGVSVSLPQDLALSLNSHLERLGETFARLSPTLNPNREYFTSCLLDLVQRVIAPLLYTLMQHFAADEKRMDKLCRIFKWVIKTTRLAFLSSGLQPLLQQLHASFSAHPHACFLYLLSVCIDHFGAHPLFQPFVVQILPLFLANSLRTIPSTAAMVHDPDMTEDFFETCTKTVNRCPDILFKLSILPQIIEHVIFALPLHHRDCLSSVTHFFALFLEHGLDTKKGFKVRMGPVVTEHQRAIQQCLQMYGPAIVNAMIQCIAGGLPQYRLHMLAGPIEGILAFCGEGCHGWFTDALSKLPETVDPTKEEFRSLLLSYNPNTSYDSFVRNLIERYGEVLRIKDA